MRGVALHALSLVCACWCVVNEKPENMATNYAKWAAFDDSSEDDDLPAPPTAAPVAPSASTPPAAAADAATIIERLTRAERLGEEVLAERRQMVELDRQRNQNREALAALRRMDRDAAASAGVPAPTKHWMCMGDVFLRRPHATTRQLLEEEQARIETELEGLRTSVTRKTSALCELDPSIMGGSNIHRSFRDLHGMSAAELERQRAFE